VASASVSYAWTPGTGSPGATDGFAVDTNDRLDVLSFYNTIYTASSSAPTRMAWTGNIATGQAGTTSSAYKDDVLRRINFYRALVQLPADITFDSTFSAKNQAAALMFSANDDISHFPPNTWTWYTADGADAASHSNIAYGLCGPDTVDGYIFDDGSNNIKVGHRRWLLYPRQKTMGTGDVPETGAFGQAGWYSAANAIWVLGTFKPSAPAGFVAWPNRGYSPFTLMPDRWSLSYPNADFSSATVTITQGSTNIPATVISRTDNGYGDNTIVWEPQGLPTSIGNDVPFSVSVSGIKGSGVPTSITYPVILFDPSVLGQTVAISGPTAPPSSGASYTFTPVSHADAYQLRVSKEDTSAWTEGAETATAALVLPGISSGYSLQSTFTSRSGSKAFHLTSPDFKDQSFALVRDILPSAGSQLQFFERGYFATTTTTLSAEVSMDNGNTWVEVWKRSGAGLSSANWDSSYISHSVSLAAYSGQILNVRFIMRINNASAVVSTNDNCGFYIDDITVKGAAQLIGTATTTLPGSVSSFILDATSAGSPLSPSDSYILRVRPQVGTRWFGDSAPLRVSPVANTTYSTWAASFSPALSSNPAVDSRDCGIANGVLYAFGLDPQRATPASLPQPQIAGSTIGFNYTQPAAIIGVTYGAQWSTDLSNWTDIPDTGSGSNHTFVVSKSGQSRMFLRHVITVSP
jgi:hypothetical protein